MARPKIDQQVNWVYTEDLAGTCDFYRRILGLEEVLDEGGNARIFRTCGNAFIGVCRVFEGRAVEPSGSMVSIVTDEVDAWYERLRAEGVELRGPPQLLEAFNIYTLFAKDPNGYAIEFQQFLDPRWKERTG
jgi:catechol 2,3-dioxygenase-like lactoylglutathione lyase family enzyme